MNVGTTLDKTVINVHDTAFTAGLALGEVNALELALGLSMALNIAEEFIKTGEFSSDVGEFSESISSTSFYCMDLTVYNNATVYNDIDCRVNIYSTLYIARWNILGWTISEHLTRLFTWMLGC